MSMRELDRLTGTALVEPTLGQALLNGQRDQVLVGFDLTMEEQTMLTRIEAQTLAEFFQQLYRWMSERNGHQLPLRGSLGRTWSPWTVEQYPGPALRRD
jgi:hypothetical protein